MMPGWGCLMQDFGTGDGQDLAEDVPDSSVIRFGLHVYNYLGLWAWKWKREALNLLNILVINYSPLP